MRRPFFVLRIVSTARAICIGVVAASWTASSIAAAAASPTSRCCHGRDSITKGVSARSTYVNATVAVHATERFRVRREIESRCFALLGRVGLNSTGGCCENATKAHGCREARDAMDELQARACDAVLAPWHTCGWSAESPRYYSLFTPSAYNTCIFNLSLHSAIHALHPRSALVRYLVLISNITEIS